MCSQKIQKCFDIIKINKNHSFGGFKYAGDAQSGSTRKFCMTMNEFLMPIFAFIESGNKIVVETKFLILKNPHICKFKLKSLS